jgi:glucuronate isomerase
MLIQMARMSVDDGLVMQIHIGSFRNHNPFIFQNFGRDMGADIPVTSEFTRNLKPLLDTYGTAKNLTIVLFNLDETTYSRELAPLAGHYPVLRLGPPWWFFDSFNGMKRFFDTVVETAGIYNTAGFNDDTRAYPSIPARHDLWRRACADWLAELTVRGLIAEEDAADMVTAMAYSLAKQTYRLG